MIDLFSLNNKGTIVINRPEICLYPELNIIVTRDIDSRKVADITKVFIPFRELHYIYELCDYRSYCNRRGMSDKEADKYAKEVARLDNNWKPDDIVKGAIIKYRKEQDSVSLRAVIALRKSLDTSMNIASDISEYNKMLYEKMKKMDEDDNKKVLITEFINRQRDLDNLIANVTKNIVELKNSEELLKKEENIKRKGRGKVDITNSMKYE